MEEAKEGKVMCENNEVKAQELKELLHKRNSITFYSANASACVHTVSLRFISYCLLTFSVGNWTTSYFAVLPNMLMSSGLQAINISTANLLCEDLNLCLYLSLLVEGFGVFRPHILTRKSEWMKCNLKCIEEAPSCDRSCRKCQNCDGRFIWSKSS